MIGTKNLSTIRQGIEGAFTAAGADPIQRLEQRIASAQRQGDRTKVMEGLKRCLESPRKENPRKARKIAKEWTRQAPGTPGKRER